MSDKRKIDKQFEMSIFFVNPFELIVQLNRRSGYLSTLNIYTLFVLKT